MKDQEIKALEHLEPILAERGNKKYILGAQPEYPDLWESYVKQKRAFWDVDSLDLSKDINDWKNKLNDDERHFLSYVLAFFASSDVIVMANISLNFDQQVQIQEAKLGYAFQNMMEGIHCVAPETQILTDRGYLTISDFEEKQVNIWNGEEFSEVTIKKTSDNTELVCVELDNGMDMSCTLSHKWAVQTGDPNHPERCTMMLIETQNLDIGSILYDYALPVIDISNETILNPYTHGFFCGDGTYCNNYPMITLYGEKIQLIPHLALGNLRVASNESVRTSITKTIDKEKFFVPLNHSLKTRLEWLAGYVDADGCVAKSKAGNTAIQAFSIEFDFLKKVQLLLTTLGIQSNIKEQNKPPTTTIHGKTYNVKKIYMLYITATSVNILLGLGFRTHRLHLLSNNLKQNKRRIRVKNISRQGRFDKTFCFNEPKRHLGTFNGILTGQSEVYSLLIQTYVEKDKQNHLFNAIEEIPAVKKKAEWAISWLGNQETSFAQRLVAFACVECIQFSSSFASIAYMNKRGLLPGLSQSNQYIRGDEAEHVRFAVMLYNHLNNRLDEDVVHRIVKEAVDIEEEFCSDALPVALIGMNADEMKTYVRFIADYLLSILKYTKLYNVSNPFPFMDTHALESKENFFERKNVSYATFAPESREFNLDADF